MITSFFVCKNQLSFLTDSRILSCVPILVFSERSQLLRSFLSIRDTRALTAAEPKEPLGTLTEVSGGCVIEEFGRSLKHHQVLCNRQ